MTSEAHAVPSRPRPHPISAGPHSGRQPRRLRGLDGADLLARAEAWDASPGWGKKWAEWDQAKDHRKVPETWVIAFEVAL